MKYNNYQNQTTYSEMPKQQFEQIDYSQFKLLPCEAQVFRGEITSVIQRLSKWNTFVWGITLINRQTNQMTSVTINAGPGSRLAQQLLLITTGDYESVERTCKKKDGTDITFIDNVKGDVYVALSFVGYGSTNNPIFNALNFFYADGRSLEEAQNPNLKPCTHIAESLALAKQITQEKMNEIANNARQQVTPQSAIRPVQPIQQQAIVPQAQPSPYVMPPLNNQSGTDDIPF